MLLPPLLTPTLRGHGHQSNTPATAVAIFGFEYREKCPFRKEENSSHPTVQHRGRAIRPDKAGSPTSISADEGEEQQQQIIPTRKKKGLRLAASIAHLRTQTATADGPPATIARDLDEIRGSPTPLAPRRRQKPRLTANRVRRNLFRRDTTTTASAASPSTLTLPHTHLANRPEVPPPSRRRSGRRRETEMGLVAS